MKPGLPYYRMIRRRDRKSTTSRSLEARFRDARFKLEGLENRTLLATSPAFGPYLLPAGLGLAYTAMAEQAYGDNLHTTSPGQLPPGGTGSINTSNPVTLADLKAYLKSLGLNDAALTNAGAGLPQPNSGLSSTGQPVMKPIGPPVQFNPGSPNNPNQYYLSNLDNPEEERLGQYAPNINDPGNQLNILKHNPLSTGISKPALAPTIISGFNGMNFLDSVNGYVPPDTDMAVGPQFVVETVNAQIQIYDKSTGVALLGNTPLNEFFGQPGESPFDPVVTYDDVAGRFIVAADTFAGHLLIAASNGSNPFDGFSTYDLDISEGGAFSPDYTKIGWNADEVVITYNMYSNSTGFFDHVQGLSFAASSLFASSPPPTLTLGTDYFSFDRFNNDFTMAPASMHGAAPGDPMYFVEENSYDNGSQMRVVSATDLLSFSPSFTDSVVNVDPYTLPPSANQPNGFIQTNDTRILNAEWRDGLLVADQNVGLLTDTDAHARWYEFNVTGAPSLVQDGTIAPAQGTSTYFPAITIAPGDVIGMVYNESGPTEFPSVYDTGRTTADPLGTMETPVEAVAGTATYEDFAFRWGDYSGIGIDPTDGSIWSGAEYSTSLLAGFPANWATYISHFVIAPSVISSDPAAGSVVTGAAPTTFSLTFSEPIDPNSITASDLQVDGTGADSASLSADGLTITYTYNTSPVAQQGSETMDLPAGSVKGAGDGIGNSAFHASFFYVITQLQVSATSPAVGSVLTVPVTDMVVQFNTQFDLGTLSASDFQLSQGNVVSAVPLTSQAVDLTLSGITQDGSLTLTVPAGALLDLFGVPNLAFTGNYIVDIATGPYPTPLVGKPPAGGLIYDPSVTGSIGFVGDTDTYTLPLAAGQTLSLLLSTDPSLIGTITLQDPSNNAIASATAASAGANAVIETAPITTAGTYSLIVSGSGGTTGGYTLQAILNALYKQATDTNNSIATAADLSNAFTSLGTTPYADRAGVLGTTDSAGDSDFYKFWLNSGQSTTLALQGLNGNIALGLFDGSGNLLALPSGATLNSGLDLSGGFSGATSQLTLNGNANLSGSNLDLTDGGFSEAGSAFTKSAVNVTAFQTSFNFQVAASLTFPLADGFTFTIQGNSPTALGFGGGDLGYGTIGKSVAIKFDYFDNAGEGTDSTGIFTDGQDPFVPAIDLTGTGVNISSGDVMNVTMTYDGSTLNVTITDTVTLASASQSYAVDIPGVVGSSQAYVGFTGGTGGLTSIPAILNWSYTTSPTISSAKFESINNFVASTAGWYYAGVSAGAGTNYSLIATRGSDFTLHGGSFDKAQPLDGVPVVLGAIVKGSGGLFTLDDQLGNFSDPQNPIWATDPTTGQFTGNPIQAPGSPLNNPFGLNMAFDGTYIYYNNGQDFGDNTIYKIDPTTGTVVDSVVESAVPLMSGLAYLNGKLYGTAGEFAGPTQIYVFDASTLAYETTLNVNITDSFVVGLAGDPDLGVLFAVGQPGFMYEIDPSTGNVLGESSIQSQHAQDLAYANGELIVSNAADFGLGFNTLDEYDPSNFALIQSLPVAALGYVSGLAGDGLGGISSDWYQFNVNAGDNLVLTTTTPGGSSANGLQFINDLDPTINLYDASGNLVATATGNAADGRNDVIDWTALSSGSYRVQILGSDKTNLGEYTIAIQGATGGPSPFQVTATNPAAGSDIGFQVSSMTVSLNGSLLLSSVSPSDFMIDGNDATGVTVLDDHTLSFSFDTTSNGIHNVAISGFEDIHGVLVTPDNFSFETDDVPPFVVSSSIPDGAVLSPGPLTEVVTFSKPIQPSSVSTSDISLFGEIRGIGYTPSSISFDPTDTILTITYSNLPVDAYQFVLEAGPSNFLSLAGVPLQNNFVINFTMPGGESTISGLQPVLPLGSLVYEGTVDSLLLSSDDVDTFDLSIDPHQTLAVTVTPVTKTMTATVTLLSPTGNVIGVATSPSPGAPAVLFGVQSSKGGTYRIVVTGGPGEYKVQPVLNALLDPAANGGTPNTSIATAQPIDPYANKFAGNDDRTAVLGALSSGGGGGGTLYSTDRFSQGLYTVDKSTGASTLVGFLSNFTSFSGMAIDPSTGTTYISDVFGSDWSLATIDLSTGQENIIGVQGDTDIHALVMKDGTLYGFSFSRGIGTMNTSTGFFTPSFPFDTLPEPIENAAIDTSTGTVYGVGQNTGSIYTIDLSTGVASLVGNPLTGNSLLIGLAFTGGSLYELGYNGGSTSTPLFQIDPTSAAATVIGPNGLEAQPDALTSPPGGGGGGGPAETSATYSFSLSQGESATMAIQSLNGKKVQFALLDEDGDVLGLSSPGATNYTAGLNNFVSLDDATYYISVTGDPGVKFNLVVTRGADFTTQQHTTLDTAQDITPTQQTGDNKLGGALGSLQNPSGAFLGTTIEGIDFNGSNCGCLPPDTNAAVGNGFVAETVNVQFRVWDTAGNVLLDEPLDTLFGFSTGANGGDPYVEYDAGAGRWYVTAVDNVTAGDEFLAVSNDADPTHGFTTYEVPLAAPGDFPDFTKFGYNADAIVLSAQDFSNSTGNFVQTVVTTVDKTALLSGTLTDYQSVPPAEFRALTPAQMHGAAPGAPMWFISTDGYTFPANTIRVTELTNELSNSPTYTTFSLAVNTFDFTTPADQPGGPGSVETNDPTTTSVDFLNGLMVTALPATDASDGFTQTHVHWYEVDVSGGTPTLVQEGLINPGSGVATYFGAAAIDSAGNIGLSYMESSSTEYVSAYVAGHIAGTPLGTTTAGTVFGPGGGPMPVSFREGDYGSAVYDPGTGLFWGANEYIGSDGDTDIWRTKITSFSLVSAIGTDFYSVNSNDGDNLHFATSTPAGGPLEFVNNFYPELLLYDPNGNLVAVAAGNAADGRNSVIDFTVPQGDAGAWVIEVTASPNTDVPSQGEYGLLVTGATGAVASFVVTSTNPPDGALIKPPTDYIATFSKPILATSLTAGELTINGVPAIGVTLVDAFTVDWTIDPASIPAGNRVLNTAVISADASGNQVMDVSGGTLIPFTSTFTTDSVAPSIVSSSIDGQVFSPAPASVTEVVTFDEPMNTAFTTAASFELLGNFRNAQYAAASFSWDSTGTVLTINYANLPDDTYTLTLFAGGFEDLVGNTLTSDYVANFAVALGTAAFTTPFTPVPPLGDLIYTSTDDPVLVTPTDVDYLTLNLNAGETLTLVGTPNTPSLQLVLTVLDPSSNAIGTTTAPAQGANATIETIPIAVTGAYTIAISDANGNTGLYSIQAYLNSYVKQGTANLSIPTAQDLTGSSYLLGPGNADRLGVVGSLPTDVLHVGDVYVSSRFYGFDFPAETISDILRVNSAGEVVQVIPVGFDPFLSLSGVELDPANNMLYAAVTTSFNDSSVDGELLEFDPISGQQVATIPLPTDNANVGFFYPYGFSIATDGTFWISQPNSQNIIHLDSSYNEISSFSTAGLVPESASIGIDGNVYFTGIYDSNFDTQIYKLDTTSGAVSFFSSSPAANLTSTAPGGTGIWSGDYFDGALRYDYSGNLVQNVGFFGTNQAQTDQSGNVWTPNTNYWDLFKFDEFGNEISGTFVPLPIGLTIWGVDNPNPTPQDTQDYYSFSLAQGQSATIVAKSLNNLNVQITLVDGDGNVLATGVGGSTNVSSKIENFVAPSTGTYYVEITGDPGVQYSLTVTRGADFDIEPHGSPATAQSLTGTNGALGALDPGGSLTIGQSFAGIDFASPNNPCGCLPPDTNAAVGPTQVVETVNEEIRVFDKSNGAIVYDASLATFFGQGSGGDVYVVYDDLANRWYVTAFNGDFSGLVMAVSNDSNFLDGFLPTYNLTTPGGAPDYPKPGFNKDAIFVEYNDFSTTAQATIITINKADALAGTLTTFLSTPEFEFQAMTPAQMHGDTTGGIEWFFSTDGTNAGGDTMRVTEMTNYLSTSPTFTYTSVPVAPFENSSLANQPGGTWTTFPNTTTYEVQYRNGMLVTAMASATAADGFVFPKGLYYEVDVSSGTPTLVLQGVIDPGPGVAVQMPSVDIDSKGNLGFTWMEGSSSEFVSMWVGSLDTSGHFSSFDAAPSSTFFTQNFRIGDYSTVVLDPSDGTTFWAANEYAGPGAASSDIWNTQITSFSLPPAVNNDWYSVDVAAGNALDLQTYTPSDQGGQFPNTAAPNIELYDTFGNLVAIGTVLPDGRNEALFFNAPVTGRYYVRVFNSPGNSGEYFLSVSTAAFAAGGVAGQVYNDLNGSGTFVPGDPGLDNWEIDVYDSSNNIVASQMTSGGGNFDIEGLAPGTYTVAEVLQAGWTQTAPPTVTFTVTVTAGATTSGLQFGDFKNITVSGEKFNDLNGDGTQEPGEPGLPDWTIDLFDAAGTIIATTTTDMNGDYSFANLGPGTYTVQEELQPGWIQTDPAPPGTYTVAATSGQDVSGLVFGNFQLVTYSGTVYDDLAGNGVLDPGDPGLQGWTVNLLDSSNNIVATTTSAADGSYSFADLSFGVYTIEEINQAGWYQTEPAAPGTYTVTATSGASTAGLDFGNFQTVNVTGNVYNDLNGNGNLDPGDPGLEGWTVNLLNAAGNLVATTTSDANGNYEFDGLFPGEFTVAEVLQSGWIQTQPVNPNSYSFATQSGLDETGLNFGNYQSITISGNVYNDVDGNGLRGAGEPGLASWTVDLEDSSGNVLATVLTDSSGNYAFAGVGAGTYLVAEVVQTNWVQTQPSYPTVYTVVTQEGVNVSGRNFGDHNSPALNPVDVIDNGQPGYAETGPWTTANGGFNGTTRFARTVRASGGVSSQASWTFTGVAAGTYDVYVTFAGKTGYSSAAPFTVSDGGTGLGTQHINESSLVTATPGQGLTQGSYGGVGWLELGTYSISSGQLKIVLDNSANGNFVDADGFLIVAHGVAPQGVRTASTGATTAPSVSKTTVIGVLPKSTTSAKVVTSATPTTVAISGVSAPTVVHVVYKQGAPASNSKPSASLVDAALGAIEKTASKVKTVKN
jgi:Legume lectin domain/SdrD B-like domain/Bacterial pre-peptidase C-terminal domain/Bacterial Ig-like domain